MPILLRRVAKLATATLFVFSLLSCGTTTAGRMPIYVDVDGQEQWVIDATLVAQDVWRDHNVDIILVAGGQIDFVVTDLPPDRMAEFRYALGRASGTVAIEPWLARSPSKAACAVAHEIGHALMMRHVEVGESLLSPKVAIPSTGGCFWSEFDEAEFCLRNPDLCEVGE